MRASHITLPLPIDLRLADAVGETERFDPVEIRCPKPTLLLERCIPCVAVGVVDKRLETARLGEEHHHEMRHARGIAPFPLRRSVASHITQAAGPIFLRHSGQELRRKARQNRRRNAERLKTGGSESDLHRGGGRRHRRDRTGDGGVAQPGSRGRNIFHAQVSIRGLLHLPVAEADQALHVAIIDFALLHRRATHSRASCSLIDDDSKPSRMRRFLSKSIAVKPG